MVLRGILARTLFSPGRATARLLFGATLISLSPVFVKLTTVPALVSATYRVLIGGVVLVLYLSWRGQMRWPTGSALLLLVVSGAFFAGDLAAWHQSILYVGPGLATLLANFQVFIMALVGVWFLKETMSRAMWLAIPLAMIGLAMIAGFDWAALAPTVRSGMALGLAAAVLYSGFMLGLRKAQILTAHADTGPNLAVACLIAAPLLVVSAVLQGQSLAIPSLADGVYLLAYALIAQVFGWLLITSALGNVPAARVGLVLLLQPALSFVWDVLLFERRFTTLELGGAAIALIAIYLGSRPARVRRP